MNYWREILEGSGGVLPPENCENLGLLECISCTLEKGIRDSEQNRKRKSPLKLVRMQARFFCSS